MSQGRVKLLAHISSFVILGAIVASFVLPSGVGYWFFIGVFVLAFVLGPITSGRWRPRAARPVPTLALKPNMDDPDVRAAPEPTDAKAFAKKIGLDG